MKESIKIILLVLLLASCRHNSKPTVQELIAKYALTSKNHWVNDERTLQFYTYTNDKTDSLLYIVVNQKGDTLIKYTGRCMNCGPNFFKLDGTWLATVNYAYQNPLYFEQTGRGYDANMYFQDSIHYYIADTVEYSLKEFFPINNDSIVAMAKRKFRIEGRLTMVHQPFSKWITIAKDTLDTMQVYYQIESRFEPAKINGNWCVIPSLDYIHPIGLYQEGKIVNSNYIVAAGQSCFYADWHESFSEKYFLYNKYLQTDEIWLVMRKCHDLKQSRVLKKIPKDEFSLLLTPDEQELDPEFVSQERINVFGFYNNYFITTNLPDEDWEIKYFPNTFLLDTLNWKLDPVKSINGKFNSKIKNTEAHPVIFGSDYKARGLNFIDQFTILKTDTGYFLVRKN